MGLPNTNRIRLVLSPRLPQAWCTPPVRQVVAPPMGSNYHEISVGGGNTAQPLALQKRLRFIRKHLTPARTRFLDCGCGVGDYVFALVDDLRLDAYGVEYDVSKVASGKLHPRYGARISQGDLQDLKMESEQWDYAMLNEVLEHVPDERMALREVWRILKPGGVLFVISPNRWFPFETHGVHLKRSGRRIQHWVPFIPYIPLAIGNQVFDYWARNYWQDELKQLVNAAGFAIIDSGFIWQTFEAISGGQPKFVALLKPLLRKVADTFEAWPFVKRFGASQVLVCRKSE